MYRSFDCTLRAVLPLWNVESRHMKSHLIIYFFKFLITLILNETKPATAICTGLGDEMVTSTDSVCNPVNTKLYPICHLLALLGARQILHVSRVRVKLFGATIIFF